MRRSITSCSATPRPPFEFAAGEARPAVAANPLRDSVARRGGEKIQLRDIVVLISSVATTCDGPGTELDIERDRSSGPGFFRRKDQFLWCAASPCISSRDLGNIAKLQE